MSSPGRARRPQRAAGSQKERQLDRTLLSVVDRGLAGCIFVVPLLMGGRQALGQLVLVTLAFVIAVAWALRQGLRQKALWRPSSAELLLVAGVLLLMVQLLPLPQSLLAWAAPHTSDVLPLCNGQQQGPVSLGAWSQISTTLDRTWAAVPLFAAYGLLFLVTVQRIRATEDVERLLGWIALSAVLMASFGLVQLLTSNGKFFWFYEHPFSRTSDVAKGSFTNRNHFAHFLALGMGPLLWWLQHGREHGRQPRSGGLRRLAGGFRHGASLWEFRSVALGVVAFAGLLSLSRGGVLVMFLAAAICVAVCYRAGTVSIRFVLSLAGIGLLIGALLAVDGYDRVTARLDDLGSGSMEELDRGAGRRLIWATVLRAIPDYALFGSGVGSHREVYPMYLDQPVPTEYTHAESGPLQVLLETGTVGFTLVLAGVGFCVFWCAGSLRRAKSRRLLVCAGAISASLAVSVAHSLADFVWYVPACTALVALLAGCACRTWQLSAQQAGKEMEPVRLPRQLGLAAALGLAVVGAWLIAGRIGPVLAEPHWDRYQILALASSLPDQPEDQSAAEPSPGELREESLETLNRTIAELQQVVRWNPHHARAHVRLAGAYLHRFDLVQQTAENAMPLGQIRDAAIRARSVSSDQEVAEWLGRVLGERRADLDLALQHTRQGLALCPLQGEGYLYLAELCFLEDVDAEAAKWAYVRQALRLRPFDGEVLFEAGREAWMAGDYEQGLAYWQQSFDSGPTHQRRLMRLLAGRVPVAVILETFQPDLHALRLLHARYRSLDQPGQLAELRRHHVRAAQAEAERREGEDAAAAWLEAQWLCCLLGDSREALRCAERAYGCDPNNYHVRLGLGKRLAEHRQFAEAEKHLGWCLRRHPGDQALQALHRRVVKGRIDEETRTAACRNMSGPLH